MALITTLEQLVELVEYYSAQDAFAFDVETIGDDRSNPHVATVAWLSMATHGRADVIPLGHPNGSLLEERPALVKTGLTKLARGVPYENLKPYDFSKVKIERRYSDPPDQLGRGTVFQTLRPLFFGPALKIGHNLRFDLHAVAKYYDDERPTGPYYDTLIASWLIDVTRKGWLGLEDCYHRETGKTMVKGVGKDVSQHSFEEVAEYSLLDAQATWEIWESLVKQYDGNSRLCRLLALEMLVLNPVLEMESTGVRLDIDVLREIDEGLRKDLARTKGELVRLSGRQDFKVRSNKHRQEVLFLPKKDGGQGLRPLRRTPSAEGKAESDLTVYDYKVDQELLEARAGNPFVDALTEFNKKDKIHNTYVLPYLGGHAVRDAGEKQKYIASRTRGGRVYGSFNQFGTETGRFSSSNPNLQNIPSRSAEGLKLRGAFIPDPGFLWIAADYSQIEPRIIASLSGDKTLIRTYLDGGDVYEVVGQRMGVPRAAGKELVLSISYGVGAPKIAAKIGCSVTEARGLMEYFSRKFPAIDIHKRRVIIEARRNRYSSTLMGRRRSLPRIVWTDQDERASAERQAYNHLIQGTAADIMKIALVNIHASLPDEAKILLTVHDEVGVQAPVAISEETAAIIKHEMEAATLPALSVPLVADIKIVNSWKEGK